MSTSKRRRPLLLASLLAGALLAGPVAAAPAATPAAVAAQDGQAFDTQLAAAGSDVAKLLALADACTAAGQSAEARKAFAKVLEVDAANEAAHKGLNHQFYDGRWFESFSELAKFKRDEDAQMKAKGLVRLGDGWVPEAELPFRQMGWVQGGDGAWLPASLAAREQQAAEWQKAGWEYRADDDSWVSPDEQSNWAHLLWKCDDEWLETRVADAYHAEIGRWWRIAGEHFTVWTTCEWSKGNRARWYADRIQPDLVRLFGLEPARPPHVVVLNSLAQYNEAAGGNPPQLPESRGVSSAYGAYFADTWFDAATTPREYRGCGVSFWDGDRSLDPWGPYWLRWAAAQSWIEAIDPSWNAIGQFVSGSGRLGGADAIPGFWEEKRIPAWLRNGAASYCERFLKNPEAAEGADPWGIRAYAFGELQKAGGLRPLDKVFAFQPDPKKPEDLANLYHEAGLVVSFLLDGAPDDRKLAAAHATFRKALASGSKADVTSAVEALQKALVADDKALRAFAGL